MFSISQNGICQEENKIAKLFFFLSLSQGENKKYIKKFMSLSRGIFFV